MYLEGKPTADEIIMVPRGKLRNSKSRIIYTFTISRITYSNLSNWVISGHQEHHFMPKSGSSLSSSKCLCTVFVGLWQGVIELGGICHNNRLNVRDRH